MERARDSTQGPSNTGTVLQHHLCEDSGAVKMSMALVWSVSGSLVQPLIVPAREKGNMPVTLKGPLWLRFSVPDGQPVHPIESPDFTQSAIRPKAL